MKFATEQFTLAQLYGAPGVLERIVATPAARKDLHARAKAAARLASNDQARGLLESVAVAGKEWKDEDPGVYVSTVQRVPASRPSSGHASP